jgi:hypothetical protein
VIHPRPFEKSADRLSRSVPISRGFYLRTSFGAARNKGGKQ